MKHEEIVKRLGLSFEELNRLKWNHHLENWKDAQKTPVTELPLADFWQHVQSFLDKLDAQRRPPNSMAPPITVVGINGVRSETEIAGEPIGEQNQKTAIRKKIEGDPKGASTSKEAAIYFGTSPKTIRSWANDKVKSRHLQWGAKHRTITNESILKLQKSLNG